MRVARHRHHSHHRRRQLELRQSRPQELGDRYQSPIISTTQRTFGSANPFALNVREAYPGLNLDKRSPDYIDQVKKVIATDIAAAGGRAATQADFDYWIPKFLGECDSCLVTGGQMTAEDYWHRRLLGMGAGGADVARFGPYAGGDGAPASNVMGGMYFSNDELFALMMYFEEMLQSLFAALVLQSFGNGAYGTATRSPPSTR